MFGIFQDYKQDKKLYPFLSSPPPLSSITPPSTSTDSLGQWLKQFISIATLNKNRTPMYCVTFHHLPLLYCSSPLVSIAALLGVKVAACR